MRRFFFDPAQRKDNIVTLDAEESHHIARVLRLSAGAEVELLDGFGTIYSAKITDISRYVTLQLGRAQKLPAEGNTALILFQSILKGSNMDLAVQKATELGVRTMQPVQISRCQGKLSAAVKKYERWQRISLAACKQCMRPTPMEISQPLLFGDALALPLPNSCAKILFWEEEERQTLHDIADICKDTPAVAIFLGPEGGIRPDEVADAQRKGWQSVRLGERILRADTASISAVTLLQYLTSNI